MEAGEEAVLKILVVFMKRVSSRKKGYFPLEKSAFRVV